MPYVKIRRCHITCRVESDDALRKIISCPNFVSVNGGVYAVFNMTAAYNAGTEEARIYSEFARVDENVIEYNMTRMGAKSIVIDSFSSDTWETASEFAFKSVVECGGKDGFFLIRHGTEPKASSRMMASGEGSSSGTSTGQRGQSAGGGRGDGGMGGGAVDDDEEEEPSSADDRGRSKRPRTSSGGREMVSVDAMTATLSSVIASAIASSGSAASSAVASKTNDLKDEQRRRENAEQRVREMEMEQERARIEKEVARQYEERLRAKVCRFSYCSIQFATDNNNEFIAGCRA
jgi:hypothetical protein